jgi:RHS repeat-associated protein
MTFGIYANGIQNASISGTKTTGNTLTIIVHDPALSGGQKSETYTVLSSDTLTTIATGIKTTINSDSSLSAIGVTATSAGTVVSIASTSTNATWYSQSTSSGATEVITLTANQNPTQFALIGGTKTTGDVLTLTTYDAALSGGSVAVTYSVLSTDTLATIATGLAAAINANSSLTGIGISASSSSTIVSINSNSANVTSYRQTVSAAATETVSLTTSTPGWRIAVIGGTKHTGDTLTITAYNPSLSGGTEAVNYPVLSTDTLTSIASGIASAVNSDSNLAAIGVTATSSSTVVSLQSTSPNLTTYASSVSGGSTETISLNSTSGVFQASYNNVNELTGLSPGGAVRFQGTTNKAIQSASVTNGSNNVAATLAYAKSFSANGLVPSGSSQSTVSAIDGAGNNTSIPVQQAINGGSSSTLTFDANGNMTSDGTNTYQWDAENRLIQINYPGTGNYSTFTYDGTSRNVKILEYSGGTLAGTSQFVRTSTKFLETRDASGSLQARYFTGGQTNASSNFYFTEDAQMNPVAADHYVDAGSIREITDSSGNVVSQFSYDPYGRQITIAGSGSSNQFGYDRYFLHYRSGLNLTQLRAYSPVYGRFQNRDPLGETGGTNIFAYCANDPTNSVDPTGELPWYGNWGGPNWGNGREQNEVFPDWPRINEPNFVPPIDQRDCCYYNHDVCLNDAGRHRDPGWRQNSRRGCDIALSQCLSHLNPSFNRFPGELDFEIWLFGRERSPNNNPDIWSGLPDPRAVFQ